MTESTVRDRLIAAIRQATDDGASKTEDVADTILESGAWPPALEDALERATWALIEYDTDTADRGVSDEHYRERRADVERVAPILAVRGVEMTPENELKARQLSAALAHIYLDIEIGDRAREVTQNFPPHSEFDVTPRPTAGGTPAQKTVDDAPFTERAVHCAADAIARARGYVRGASLDEHYRDGREAIRALLAAVDDEALSAAGRAYDAASLLRDGDPMRAALDAALGGAVYGEVQTSRTAPAKSEAELRLAEIIGRINAADDGDDPPTLRDIYLIAQGRI